MDYNALSLEAHSKYKGKIDVVSKVELKTRDDLSIYYTPGVAEPCRKIAEDKELSYEYTSRANMVAVISDGSAVLGLGNIGPEAAMPVMEGKAILFKEFAGVSAFPIVLDTQNVEEIIATVKNIAPSFGGINLEDISAPRCFEIEDRLKAELDIPVFHDDQHGTAIVCLAGLINSLKIVEKEVADVRVVISGAGAAGIAIAKLLLKYGFLNVMLQDSQGLIYEGREGLNFAKEQIAKLTNKDRLEGGLKEALEGADIFIGVSQPDLVDVGMVKSMANDAIIFAMSNPSPEVRPEVAKAGGVRIMATGRSDFPNQINNVLVFPGIFKGALKARVQITDDMKVAAAEALAALVKEPHEEKIIPGVFDEGVADVIAAAVIGG